MRKPLNSWCLFSTSIGIFDREMSWLKVGDTFQSYKHPAVGEQQTTCQQFRAESFSSRNDSIVGYQTRVKFDKWLSNDVVSPPNSFTMKSALDILLIHTNGYVKTRRRIQGLLVSIKYGKDPWIAFCATNNTSQRYLKQNDEEGWRIHYFALCPFSRFTWLCSRSLHAVGSSRVIIPSF